MHSLKITAIAAILGVMSISPASAANEADCKAMFEKADMNKDGMLAKEESVPFEKAMTGAGTKPKDAQMIAMEEFSMECSKGTFDKMTSN